MSQKKGKITLISVDDYGPSMGMRFISSVLKEAGYETTLIFAKGSGRTTINNYDNSGFAPL